MVESMEGPEEGIVDRSFEHLAPSDRMIAITRRRLLPPHRRTRRTARYRQRSTGLN